MGDRGDGLTFGWGARKSAEPIARSAKLASPDPRFSSFAKLKPGSTWQVELPDGMYDVHLVAGDAKAKHGTYALDVEQQSVLRGDATEEQRWVEATQRVTVTDGTLELIAPKELRGNKVNFMDIVSVHDEAPDPPPTEVLPPPDPAPTPDPGSTPLPTTVGDWVAGAPSPISRAEAIGTAVGG
jgi:hypothetical protein